MHNDFAILGELQLRHRISGAVWWAASIWTHGATRSTRHWPMALLAALTPRAQNDMTSAVYEEPDAASSIDHG
jgi:hypothetical protein